MLAAVLGDVAAGLLLDVPPWAKAMYAGTKGDGEWWLARTWIHDRHQIENGVMKRRPSYRIGDRIALYIVGPGRLPAVMRVAGEPYDGRVEVEELYGDAEAAKYGWVTPVEVLRASPLGSAPTLDAIGVNPKGLQNGRARVTNAAAFAELSRSFSECRPRLRVR